MKTLARWCGITEGQLYTLVIGLVIGLTTVVLGIPPALRGVPDQAFAAPEARQPAASGSDGSAPSVPGSDLGTLLAPILGLDSGFLGPDLSGDLGDDGASSLRPAGIGGPVRQAWWSSLSPLTAGAPIPPALPQSPTAPDVPPDGLYVAGGQTGPQAISALMYVLPEGTSAGTLTLEVAQGSLSSPAAGLLACPLAAEGADFTPVQGGDLAAAPAYDCSRGVKGVANTGGTAFAFPVGGLANGNRVAMAIVPVGASDRVVFSRPGDQSLSAG